MLEMMQSYIENVNFEELIQTSIVLDRPLFNGCTYLLFKPYEFISNLRTTWKVINYSKKLSSELSWTCEHPALHSHMHAYMHNTKTQTQTHTHKYLHMCTHISLICTYNNKQKTVRMYKLFSLFIYVVKDFRKVLNITQKQLKFENEIIAKPHDNDMYELSECGCVCVHICSYVGSCELRNEPQVPLYIVPNLHFWDRIFPLKWSSPGFLCWMISEAPRSCCLLFP